MDGVAGLRLLAFKDRSELCWHQFVRSCHFIYPDEAAVQGSRNLFAALLVWLHPLDPYPDVVDAGKMALLRPKMNLMMSFIIFLIAMKIATFGRIVQTSQVYGHD